MSVTSTEAKPCSDGGSWRARRVASAAAKIRLRRGPAKQRSRVQAAETHGKECWGLDRGGVRAPVHSRTRVAALRRGCRVKDNET